MVFRKLSDNHYRFGFSGSRCGDYLQYDSEQEKRKVLLWVRMCRLPDERFLPFKEINFWKYAGYSHTFCAFRSEKNIGK